MPELVPGLDERFGPGVGHAGVVRLHLFFKEGVGMLGEVRSPLGVLGEVVNRGGIGVVLVIPRFAFDLTRVQTRNKRRPCGVRRADRVRDRLRIDPVRIFVAEAPGQHAGTVLVARQGFLRTLEEVGRVGGVFDLVADPAVGHLIEDVEARFVAEFEETLGVVVVAGTDRVDVGGLHEPHVLGPVRFGQREAAVGPEVVSADAGAFDRDAVPEHDVVLDVDLAEAETLLDPFEELAVASEGEDDVVEVGFFGGPERGGGDGRVESECGGAVGAEAGGTGEADTRRGVAVGGEEFAFEGDGLAGFAGDVDLGAEGGVLVVGGQRGADGDVVDPGFRHGHKRGVTVDAAHRLVIARVAVVGRRGLGHTHGEEVALAGVDQAGQVDVPRGVAALVVTGLLAVDEDFRAVERAVEVPVDALARPFRREW